MKRIPRTKNINRSVLAKRTTGHFYHPRISAEGICDECEQDHRYKPSFDKMKTSIDTFSELLRSKRESKPSRDNYNVRGYVLFDYSRINVLHRDLQPNRTRTRMRIA